MDSKGHQAVRALEEQRTDCTGAPTALWYRMLAYLISCPNHWDWRQWPISELPVFPHRLPLVALLHVHLLFLIADTLAQHQTARQPASMIV